MRRKFAVIFLATVMAVGAIVVPETAEAQYGYGPRYRPRPVRQRVAHYRHRPHFYLGGQLGGMAVLGQELDNVGQLGHGGGLGLFAGFRFGPWAAAELNWTYSVHNESWKDRNGNVFTDLDVLQIQTLTGDFKIHIPTWGPVEPFFQAGGGLAFFGLSGLYEDASYLYAWGPMFNAGGGVNFWFGPHFSIGGRVLYRGMYFTRTKDYKDRTVAQAAESNFVNALSIDAFASLHF